MSIPCILDVRGMYGVGNVLGNVLGIILVGYQVAW